MKRDCGDRKERERRDCFACSVGLVSIFFDFFLGGGVAGVGVDMGGYYVKFSKNNKETMLFKEGRVSLLSTNRPRTNGNCPASASKGQGDGMSHQVQMNFLFGELTIFTSRV